MVEDTLTLDNKGSCWILKDCYCSVNLMDHLFSENVGTFIFVHNLNLLNNRSFVVSMSPSYSFKE